MLRMVLRTSPTSRGPLSTRCARHTRSRRRVSHAANSTLGSADGYMPSSSRTACSSRNWSKVCSSVATLPAVLAAIPSTLCISARSAARAAADTGAFATGLILSRRSWMAAARRLSASLRRWLTAAASPHTSLSFALPFESAPSMATAAVLAARPFGLPFGVRMAQRRFVTWSGFVTSNRLSPRVTSPCGHYTSPHPPPTRRRGWRVHPTTACHLGLASRAPRVPHCLHPTTLHYSTTLRAV